MGLIVGKRFSSDEIGVFSSQFTYRRFYQHCYQFQQGEAFGFRSRGDWWWNSCYELWQLIVLDTENSAFAIMIIFIMSFSFNILFWFFPDQYFAMKSIGLTFRNSENLTYLNKFRAIHRGILPLWRFIIFCLSLSIFGTFICFVSDGNGYLVAVGILILSVPFMWNCYSLMKAWQLFEQDVST